VLELRPEDTEAQSFAEQLKNPGAQARTPIRAMPSPIRRGRWSASSAVTAKRASGRRPLRWTRWSRCVWPL